ncbi:DUF6483 family protein [Paenibacillus sp. GD4]|jgi:hypothetical protein|uniref:DUF6483 family protein n=1 Tax=Paenibacillus sp. GD4 TaxID=3068890 RepID=UPI002796700B|nr:DUF6483 family protein [Paenibacillus sp. GD4]MDQ1910628.1 DUF6483 family protein [Paenibacillus sp. GD4]
MYQRDYILRLIKQAAEAIHKVMFLRKNRQLEEAMALLNQAMKQLLGLNSDLVRALSVKDLLLLLSKTGEVDLGKTLALGDMLKAEALLLDDLGEVQGARQCRLKAAELLLTARIPDALEGEWRDAFIVLIDELLIPVERSSKPEGLLTLLFPYYNETGRWAKAEDALFHYIEAISGGGKEEQLLELLYRGAEMVQPWTGLSEQELSAGGLSSEEVEELLRELQEMKRKVSARLENKRE